MIWSNPIPKNIGEMGVKLDAALSALMAYESTRTETYMRENAPWTDRTANARNGLFAKPVRSESVAGDKNALGQFMKAGVHHGIVLFHTMPYGIFLETRWSGRYAIILPTIAEKAPDVMRGTQNIMRKLGVSGIVS